jgi:hypothetical protein
MNEPATRKCPFAAPITTGRAACTKANEVVRRGGSEYDCTDVAAHNRCEALFDGLKQTGLAAFDVPDDLTQMPHSVLVKIQTGGLTGLRRLLEPDTDPAAPVHDVATLVDAAVAAHGSIGQVPIGGLADDMLNTRLERRGHRRGR